MNDALFDTTKAGIATRNAEVEARRLAEQNKRVSRFHGTYTAPKVRAEKALAGIIASSPKLQAFVGELWKKQDGRDAILLVVDYWKRGNPLGLFLFRDRLTLEVWIANRSGSEDFSRECSQDELISAIEFNHLPFTNEFERLAKPETAFEALLDKLPFRNM